MSSEKQITSKYNKVKEGVQNNENCRLLEKASEQLQKQFDLLNKIINQNEAKKQQLEKKYCEEVQGLMNSLFQGAVGSVKQLQQKIEQRNEKWDTTDGKVKLYFNIWQNVQRMRKFKTGIKKI